MNELQIVANIVIKGEYQKEFKGIFQAIVTETRKEPGCISYKLYQDEKNPLKYSFLETWKDNDALDKHNNSAHFQAFDAAIDDKIEGLTIDVLKQVL